MIGFVPQYYGWLGNQMFQYACVKALSVRSGVKCSFPEKEPNLHSIFKLNSDKLFIPEFGQPALYREPQFTYNEIPANIPDLILEGYFQSEKYFKDLENIIREEFSFRRSPVREVPKNTCSIHVRRNDYLDLKDHHPLCSMDYYLKAMSLVPSNNYMVFSDDPVWCMENFKQSNVEVVSGNTADEDLQLMTMCDNHIIANSSFSWWGSWLGHNESKKVIAPSRWFGPAKKFNTSDIYCPGWVII
tara:strand:- start:21 stop:752 length:732 start_codon:yes stop_codon:yes gene_type:complete